MHDTLQDISALQLGPFLRCGGAVMEILRIITPNADLRRLTTRR